MLFRRRLAALAIVFIFTALMPSGVFLQAQPRGLQADAAEQLDAVLLLDASGSMLLTDPQRLRDEGARLFAQFLKSEDRLSIVRFAEEAKVVRPLTPFDTGQIEAVVKQIGGIDTSGQFTDLLTALEQGGQLLLKNPRPEAKPVIVLLSDGKMEPHPAKGTAQVFTDRLLNSLLPDYKAQNIKVYTLAFSELADRELLAQIAAGTGGINWFTPDADKIHQSYAELFLALKKPQVIPFNAKGFQIDPDVQEATFYINREGEAEIKIITPSGSQIGPNVFDPKVKWFRGQRFDVVTITGPEVGLWQVTGVSPQDGFATILTNLKLVTDWPLNVDSGSQQLLQARLYESKKPVDLPEMISAVRYAFQITPTDRISEPVVREFLRDDGTRGDKIAGDGIFSHDVVLSEPGEYRLRIIAKAPTFERQQMLPFRVRPALISLRVVASGETAAEQGAEVAAGQEPKPASEEEARSEPAKSGETSLLKGDETTLFRVELSEDARSLRNIQVRLTAVDAQRNRYLLPLSPSAENALHYECPASALPQDGRFELQAALAGEDKTRGPRKENSQVLAFVRLSRGAVPQETAVVLSSPQRAKKKSWFPLWELVILALVNLMAGSGAFVMLKRAQGRAVFAVPEFQVPDRLIAAISQLEKKMAVSEVDLNSPIFVEEFEGETPVPAADKPLQDVSAQAQPAPAAGETPEAGGEEALAAAVEEDAAAKTNEEAGEEQEKPPEGST